MKMRFFLVLSIIFISCTNEIKTENYGRLFKQKTLNDKYFIYSYCRNSDFAFTDDICGTRIIKSEEPFTENKGKKIDGTIVKWINKDTLEINRFEHYEIYPKDTLFKISYEKVYEITLKINTYKGANAGSLKEYYFDNLNFLNSKIQFNGIKRKLGEKLPDTVELNLGNIEFHFANDTLSRISNNILKTSMGLTYNNGDGTYTENLPLIESIRFDFLPLKKYKKNDLLNKKGIFYNTKEKITTANTVYN